MNTTEHITSTTSPATILYLPCASVVETGERIPLVVNQRHNISESTGFAESVTLTQDGRHYDRDGGWHDGPEAEGVYVERWNMTGRIFHGWIDSVSRKLVQAG